MSKPTQAQMDKRLDYERAEIERLEAALAESKAERDRLRTRLDQLYSEERITSDELN